MSIFHYSFPYLISKVFKKMRCAAVIRSHVHKSSKVESGTSFVSSSMQRYSFCGYDCDISNAEIGAFTSIANGVVIGGARHPMEWASMSPVFYSGRDSISKKFSEHPLPGSARVNIGHDVWIGRNAVVLPGARIGNGAVVGAGAVVTKDVPAYAIAVGNPARVVKYRFDAATIERLERTQWWNFTDEQLARIGSKFNDVEALLQAVSVGEHK